MSEQRIRELETALQADLHQPALRAELMELCLATERWSELADLYEYEVGTAELDGQIRVYLAKLIDLYRDQLGDLERAEEARNRLAALG